MREAEGRTRVVAVSDLFPPAGRGGAPRALAEYVDLAGEALDFRVLTRDHDFLTRAPLPGVKSDVWERRGPALVRYCSERSLRATSLAAMVAAAEPDIVYLNSLFSTLAQRILWARRLGRLGAPRLVLAPEGELSPGALRRRALKKRAYLALARTASLYRGVTWKAASEMEQQDIAALFPTARITVVPNLSRAPSPPSVAPRIGKEPGRARLLFLGRVTSTKNLDVLLRVLAGVHGEIDLSIIGPIEDAAHWRRCRRRIARLPASVRVHCGGACGPDEVWAHYAASHAFVYPTAGENHGFVIADALASGCPVVVSDRTPWPDAGASRGCRAIALSDESAWRTAIQELVDMDAARHRAASEAARTLFAAHCARRPDVESLVRLFARRG